MTREEEIKLHAEVQAAFEVAKCFNAEAKGKNISTLKTAMASFEAGAHWADAYPHPHWISVEDELPKDGEFVLAYNGKDYTISWCAKNKWHTNMEMLDGAKPVSHWMPLPAPPKTK